MSTPQPIFERDPGREGDAFLATGHARGPWDPEFMHGGAPAALMAREIERVAPGMRLARFTMEFLGPVPMAPVILEARIVKPGGRFQIAEATLQAAGRDACRARAVLLRRGDVPDIPRGDPAPSPAAGPEAGERYVMAEGDAFGTTGMDIRFVEGHLVEPGPATAWFRLDRPLVAGEEPSAAQRAIAAADFGNGVSQLLDWNDWLFINTDLTVHLHREPEGEWVAIDARTSLEPDGSGLAWSTLHDRRGALGVALQTLFVDHR